MSDFAPTISAAGIDAPDFAQILAVLNERVREIFGDDIYIEPDSQDGQLLGVYSRFIPAGAGNRRTLKHWLNNKSCRHRSRQSLAKERVSYGSGKRV